MWIQGICAILGLITVLTGCAANRIGAPAKTLGASVATFQGRLSRFQDALKYEQDDERASIAETVAQRDYDIAWTKQLQAEWTIATAKPGTDMFSLLQSQGKDEVALLLAPTTSAALPASLLPIDKLAIVATTMKQISKGHGTKASFGELVNSIGYQAKTKPETEQATAPNK
jgi:Sec-independent protein translocase protein TatA